MSKKKTNNEEDPPWKDRGKIASRFVETLEESSKCGVCGMGKEYARGYFAVGGTCEDCNTKKEIAVWGTKEQWEIAMGKKPWNSKAMEDYVKNYEKRNKSK